MLVQRDHCSSCLLNHFATRHSNRRAGGFDLLAAPVISLRHNSTPVRDPCHSWLRLDAASDLSSHLGSRQAAWAKQDRLCCHSTSPESVLRRLEEIAPISIDDDVAVPALLVTIPVCLYIAFKILIWDYQNRPEDPRELRDGERSSAPAPAAPQRTYSWGAQPKPRQPDPLPAATVSQAQEASATVFQAYLLSMMLLRAQCAHDVLRSGTLSGPARWCYAACLLGLAEAPSSSLLQGNGAAGFNARQYLTQRVVESVSAEVMRSLRRQGRQSVK